MLLGGVQFRLCVDDVVGSFEPHPVSENNFGFVFDNWADLLPVFHQHEKGGEVQQLYFNCICKILVDSGTDHDVHDGDPKGCSQSAHLPQSHPTRMHHHLRPPHQPPHPQHSPLQNHYPMKHFQ